MMRQRANKKNERLANWHIIKNSSLRKFQLPGWLIPVSILMAVGLLTTAIISVFIASQSPASSTVIKLATVTGALPSPTSTPSTFPSATIATVLPALTPTLASRPSPIPLPLKFDGDMAYQRVLAQVALGPRPTGSEAGWATGDFILAELTKLGWQTETREFFFKGVRGRNIIGKMGNGPIILLGSHYDTRPAADRDPDLARRNAWIEGANDGASGVAVLLELARTLDADKLKNEVWLVFFDAEDRGRLAGWPFSVGARHMADNLTVNPQSVIIVDMIGDADQNIFFEQNSTEALQEEIWTVAAELGYKDYFIPELRHTAIDDHIPFLERLVPAVDIIDFDYAYWHTVEDTADKVAPASLERVGRTLEVWLEEKQ